MITDHEVVVYRLAPAGPRLDAAVRGKFSSAQQQSIRFEPAPYSRAYLKELQARIAGDRDYWTSRGVTISTLASLPTGAAVQVGVTDSSKRQAVREHYHDLPVVVVTNQFIVRPYTRPSG